MPSSTKCPICGKPKKSWFKLCYEYNVWSDFEGESDRWKVRVSTWAMGDKGIVEKVTYICYVDENTWIASGGYLYDWAEDILTGSDYYL